MRAARSLFARANFGFKNVVRGPRAIDKISTDNYPVVDEHASTNIRDYLKERGFSDVEVSAIPDIFFKRLSAPANLILIDREIAKLIALTICARSKGEHILEFDAGIGVMSKLLLPFSRDLRLYASHLSLVHLLRGKFANVLDEKVRVYDRSFQNMLGILYSRMQDSSAFLKLMEGLPLKPWTLEIPLSVITPLLHVRYLKGFIANIVEEKSLKQFGRSEFFFLIPKTIANTFMFRESCSSRNVSLHFLFNIFFDVEILLQDLPREAFLPWRSSIVQKSKVIKMSDDSLYLIHAVPKLERFEPFEENSFLIAMLTFLTSVLRTPKRIIPTFESFVPNCGPRFIIEDDLTIYTTFTEVSPEKCFFLFKKLSCYDEFDTEMLQKCVDREKLMDDEDGDEEEYVDIGDKNTDKKESTDQTELQPGEENS